LRVLPSTGICNSHEIVTATTKFISMITTASPLLDFLPAASRNTRIDRIKGNAHQEVPMPARLLVALWWAGSPAPAAGSCKMPSSGSLDNPQPLPDAGTGRWLP